MQPRVPWFVGRRFSICQEPCEKDNVNKQGLPQHRPEPRHAVASEALKASRVIAAEIDSC